jgi:hypothetical protein
MAEDHEGLGVQRELQGHVIRDINQVVVDVVKDSSRRDDERQII